MDYISLTVDLRVVLCFKDMLYTNTVIVLVRLLV